jgi:alpha-L-fucosidase
MERRIDGPEARRPGRTRRCCRKQGVHFGVSSHRAENWWFYEGTTQVDPDVKDPNSAASYGPARPQKTPTGPGVPPRLARAFN